MKKIIRILFCLSFIINLFTGCSQSSSDSNFPTLTLALREGIYSDVIRNCVSDFEKKNFVKCELIELSEEELHSLVLENSKKKKGIYDLCMVDGSWMAEYTYQGILANLSELGYKFDEDIIPATTEVCYHEDNIYLAPYYGNVTVLLYNKIIISRTGHSTGDMKSMSDLLKICKDATKKELSSKLLTYLMDKDIQKETVSYGGVPCRYSSLQDKGVLEDFPQYEAVCDALDNGIYRPVMVEWPLFYEILGTEMDQIIKGEKSVETGLAKAQKELEKELGKK